MRVLRLYNRGNNLPSGMAVDCSCFDLIGQKEVNQTMSLGYVLSRSDEALRKFLELVCPSQNINRIMGFYCVIDCECNVGKPRSQRVDISLSFYDNNNNPFLAILVEAKSICYMDNYQGAINQVLAYSNSSQFQVFPHVQPVTITAARASSTNGVVTITWSDLINQFIGLATPKQKCYSLINEYLHYLMKLQNIMNFYSQEVLVIPAGNSAHLANNPQCALYECMVGKKHYDARARSRPLYVAFRDKGGKVKYLHKVKSINQLDFNNPHSIAVLNGKYPSLNIQSRVNYYKQNSSFNLNNGLRWVFILDLSERITLPNVAIVGVQRNHCFKKLSEFLRKPAPGQTCIYI